MGSGPSADVYILRIDIGQEICVEYTEEHAKTLPVMGGRGFVPSRRSWPILDDGVMGLSGPMYSLSLMDI